MKKKIPNKNFNVRKTTTAKKAYIYCECTHPALCACINVFVIFGFAKLNTSILRDDAQNILLPTQSYEML